MDKEPLDFGLNDDTWKATTEDAPTKQAKQEPEVWYCPDCGTLSELQAKCCPDWIRSRKVPKNFALTCKATFDRNGQAEQERVTISCGCGDIYERNSFGGRFIKLHGICPNCDAASASKPRVYPTDVEIKQLFNEFGMEGIFSERQVVHRAIALYEEKNR